MDEPEPLGEGLVTQDGKTVRFYDDLVKDKKVVLTFIDTALAAGTLSASGLLAACGAGSGGQARQPVAGSLRALVGDVQQLSLLNAQRQLPAGRSRFAFGLPAESNRLVEGSLRGWWLAKDQASKALGPYPARWPQMTGYDMLCPSRMCGPVVDEQMVAFQRIGTSKANFIHLEIYPQRDTYKPAPLFTTRCRPPAVSVCRRRVAGTGPSRSRWRKSPGGPVSSFFLIEP
jgi:hypothetical protein